MRRRCTGCKKFARDATPIPKSFAKPLFPPFDYVLSAYTPHDRSATTRNAKQGILKQGTMKNAAIRTIVVQGMTPRATPPIKNPSPALEIPPPRPYH
jgi:hypothetical protein